MNVSPSGSTVRSPGASSDSNDRETRTGSSSATEFLIAVFISAVSVSLYNLKTAGSLAWN